MPPKWRHNLNLIYSQTICVYWEKKSVLYVRKIKWRNKYQEAEPNAKYVRPRNDFVNLEKYSKCEFVGIALTLFSLTFSHLFFTLLTILFVLELFSISVLFQECCFNAITFTFFVSLHIESPAPAPITEAPIDLAKKCDPAECALPYCFCSKDGTIIPGGLDSQDVSRLLLKQHSQRERL